MICLAETQHGPSAYRDPHDVTAQTEKRSDHRVKLNCTVPVGFFVLQTLVGRCYKIDLSSPQKAFLT